jgi:hypothetical protein
MIVVAAVVWSMEYGASQAVAVLIKSSSNRSCGSCNDSIVSGTPV